MNPSETVSIIDIESKARAYFDDARGSHAWDHTLRVQRLSQRIGRSEGADLAVLEVAALLHDIGRSRQDESNGDVCHAQLGAELARTMVDALSMSPQRKENILHCIRAHRYRGVHIPQSLEAKVLFDADKLDAIGAVGIARAFLFAGEVGARLHNSDIDIAETLPYSQEDTGYREYVLKLALIKDRMLTQTGRLLAAERDRFMKEFFDRFLKEYHGKG